MADLRALRKHRVVADHVRHCADGINTASSTVVAHFQAAQKKGDKVAGQGIHDYRHRQRRAGHGRGRHLGLFRLLSKPELVVW